LQRKEKETAAAKYSIESFRGSDARGTSAIVQNPAIKRMICLRG
jgi:hypothetical protein